MGLSGMGHCSQEDAMIGDFVVPEGTFVERTEALVLDVFSAAVTDCLEEDWDR